MRFTNRIINVDKWHITFALLWVHLSYATAYRRSSKRLQQLRFDNDDFDDDGSNGDGNVSQVDSSCRILVHFQQLGQTEPMVIVITNSATWQTDR